MTNEVLVPAVLEKGSARKKTNNHTWIIYQCPFCGFSHNHGGGPATADPVKYLGGRVSHCLYDSQEYILTWDGTTLFDPKKYRTPTKLDCRKLEKKHKALEK